MSADEMSIEDVVDDLVDRLGEIEGVAHVVDRCLYHEESANLDHARNAVRGIMRLADLAGDSAMALGERIGALRITAHEE